MKAMVLEQIAPIESAPLAARNVPDPQPGPGEVRVRVSCCAVCRTDLHVIEGDLPDPKLPVIPGHQVVGVVDRLGEGCGRLAIGRRIGIAWLRWTCGECEYCRAGRENLCERARFTGYREDGGYAEYAIVPESFAYELPEAAGADADAAPLLCAGIIGYRALERSNARPGCRLAMYGFGSSAHVILPIAIHRGCEVYVVTRGAGHQRLARDLGAVWTGDDPHRMPGRVDSAILFAPVGRLVPPALEMLKPGGTLALAGIHLTDIPALNYEKHLFHEREVRSVTSNTRADGRALLEAAAEAAVRPRTTTYPLDEANRALLDLKTGRLNGTAVLTL